MGVVVGWGGGGGGGVWAWGLINHRRRINGRPSNPEVKRVM